MCHSLLSVISGKFHGNRHTQHMHTRGNPEVTRIFFNLCIFYHSKTLITFKDSLWDVINLFHCLIYCSQMCSNSCKLMALCAFLLCLFHILDMLDLKLPFQLKCSIFRKGHMLRAVCLGVMHKPKFHRFAAFSSNCIVQPVEHFTMKMLTVWPCRENLKGTSSWTSKNFLREENFSVGRIWWTHIVLWHLPSQYRHTWRQRLKRKQSSKQTKLHMRTLLGQQIGTVVLTTLPPLKKFTDYYNTL